MAINFDKIFGVHTTALNLRGKRTEVLAANLANADTPGFKARDLEFGSVLKGTQDKMVSMKATHSNHISPNQKNFGAQLLYVTPHQPSLDGNTVETHIEQGKFTDNSLRYMASLRFINGNVSGIKKALRGE